MLLAATMTACQATKRDAKRDRVATAADHLPVAPEAAAAQKKEQVSVVRGCAALELDCQHKAVAAVDVDGQHMPDAVVVWLASAMDCVALRQPSYSEAAAVVDGRNCQPPAAAVDAAVAAHEAHYCSRRLLYLWNLRRLLI